MSLSEFHSNLTNRIESLFGRTLSFEPIIRHQYQHSVAFVFLLTRLFAIFAGFGCVYYVDLTVGLQDQAQMAFVVSAIGAILFAAVVTFFVAMHESKPLTSVLQQIHHGHSVSQKALNDAVKNAVLLPGKMVKLESLIDPFITILPICISIRLWTGAEFSTLFQVAIAGFLGLSCIILASFFFTERFLGQLIEDLVNRGARLDVTGIPPSTLKQKMNTSFGVTIAVAAMTIGGLAIQRSLSIANNPEDVIGAVTSLGRHTVILTFAALVIGLTFSSIISDSISTRTQRLVSVMQKVQAGDLTLRVYPTGTDEIDTLARQFNQMVEELEQQDQQMKLINTHLEELVEKRTDELRDSLDQLRELDRMKTEFFSNVSHELRTPLMMILSPIAQALKEESISAEQKQLLNVADVNAQRLLKEINHLLEFSAVEAGQVELSLKDFRLKELIERIVYAAAPLATHRQVTLTHAEDLPASSIYADEDKIETVLVNLISNAIKFTPPNGQVHVQLTVDQDKGCCRVIVEDTGIGISLANRNRIFSRFSSVDGSTTRGYSGTGLGLALSKELVELHGGTIDFESEPGCGSQFWFEIPTKQTGTGGRLFDKAVRLEQSNPDRAVDSNTNSTSEAAPRQDGSINSEKDLSLLSKFADLVSCEETDDEPESENGKLIENSTDGPRILIVDDTVEVRQILNRILRKHYVVIQAEDGSDAIPKVREYQPDLIISDVMMPNIDGIELCKRMKANPETAAIPFMLLTARARSSMKIDGLDCGADDYVTKPFQEDEVLARIRSLLRLRELHHDLEIRNDELEKTLEELNRLQDQMIRSEKMSSLGQLVAGLAHEINNSVNVVHNGLPVLTKKIEQIEHSVRESAPETNELETAFQTVGKLTAAISEGTVRTAQIVRDMKVFSHPGTSNLVDIDLKKSFQRCLNLLQIQNSPEIEVVLECDDLPTLTGRFSQLDQVFLNIVNNAIDALKSAQASLDRSPKITISGLVDQEKITVSIKDNGPGIDSESLNRIFDPFFTTKDPGKGTGLGLSLSYRIIEQAGGELRCESKVGQGCEFLISLPIRSD